MPASGCSQARVEDGVEVLSQRTGIDARKPAPPPQQHLGRERVRRKRAEFCDRLSISGHRDGLPVLDPVNDLPAAVAELPYGHSTHARSVSPVRRSAGPRNDSPQLKTHRG